MWDPLRDMDRFLNGLNHTIGNVGGPYSLLGRNRWNVTANVVEDNTHYIVEADVPGLKKEDVRVRVEDGENRVCIAGHRTRPGYYQQLWKGLQGAEGNVNGLAGDGSSFTESTVTTIDENGQVTSTTTTTNNENNNSAQSDAAHKDDTSTKRRLKSIFGGKGADEASAGSTANTNEKRPLLIEKDFGEFERCFTFPQRIVRDNTTAELEDGVLTLTVEKAYPRNSSSNVNVAVRGK